MLISSQLKSETLIDFGRFQFLYCDFIENIFINESMYVSLQSYLWRGNIMVVTGPWPGIVVMSDTARCVAVPQWPGAGCHYPHKIFTILNISAANIPSLYKVKIVLGKQVRITIQWPRYRAWNMGRAGRWCDGEGCSIIIKSFFAASHRIGVNKTGDFCGFCHISWHCPANTFLSHIRGH